MKELEIGELIEPGYSVVMHVGEKEHKSHVIKTDGSYINVNFRKLKITIPRIYTKQMSEPDKNGVYFRIYKP